MTSPLLAGEHIAQTAAELIRRRPTAGRETAALDHVAGWLAGHAVAVQRQTVPIDRVRTHPQYSAEHDRTQVDVLVARVGRQAGGRRLLLNAHVDVVAAAQADGWAHDPFEPRTDLRRLSGRGAADTLGGLAAAMHVLAVLAAQHQPELPGEVVLTPVVGEEDGGVGTLATLLTGVQADAAVVIEPTDLQIARASAGALCFRIRVPGRTAHGSVRHTGVSAIEKAWTIHQALRELEADRARRLRHPLYAAEIAFPICVGRMEGGDYRCDEAAWAHLEGRFGTPPDEPVGQARAALETAVARAAHDDPWLAEHPPTVEWIGAQWVGGDTTADSDIVTAMRTADPRAGVIGVPYGCDMGLLDQVGGLDAVVYGPGRTEAAHAVGESVAVDQLGRCAAALHRLAVTFCA